MTDDRPSSRILAAWADVSGRSKARPILRREPPRARRPITAVGALAASVVVLVIGILVIVSLPRSPIASQPPTASAPSAISSARTASPSPGQSVETSTPPIPSPTPYGPRRLADVRAGALLTPTEGWALTVDDLRVTHDGGESWAVTAQPAPAPDRIVGAAFADPLHGWVVTDRVPESGLAGVLRVDVHRTDDGGATWETVELVSIPSPGPDPLVAFPTISVLSADVVYILLQADEGTGTDVRLFATVDSGRTWQARPGLPQPALRSMKFLDPLLGWIVRDNLNALLQTVDGGKSWVRQRLPAIPGLRANDLYPVAGPTRVADGRLVLFAPTAKDGGQGAFLVSDDDGASWKFVNRGPPEGAAVAAFLEDGTWIVGGYRSLLVSQDSGTTWERLNVSLPGLIDSITVVNAIHLSAIVTIYPCGSGDCYLPQELWVSDDAGNTWRNATP
jgi:photosystem II stability/assembly factor-like uncharacterized protein